MEISRKKKDIVILGAGVSGLTAAYILSQRGFNTVVLEKNSFVGGLAATFFYKGNYLDYGPHNFHTHLSRITDFVENELGVSIKKVPLQSAKIFFNGKIINYPINIFDSLRKINLLVSLKCLLGYIYARILIKLRLSPKEDSFEEWVINRFGKYLYDLYFGPYVEKVWGIAAEDLDAIIARKRIPDPSFFLLLVRSLTGIKLGKKHSEDPELINSYYPVGGIGAISNRLAETITKYNGKVELDCDIDKVHISAGGDNYLEYTSLGHKERLGFHYIVNTIPLDRFIPMLSAPGSEKITADAQFLSYRATIFLYLFLSIDKVTDYPWIYFNDRNNKDLVFNRMYEISNFTEIISDNKKGVMCLEITCYKDDFVWKKTDVELFDMCIHFLENNSLLQRSKVKEILVKRIDTTYPVFKKGYGPHLINILSYFIKLGNIITLGRQGLFSYTNIDHCLDMGLKLGNLVQDQELDTSNFLNVYKEYIYY